MRFKGQLLLPSEQGPGLPVDLQIAEHHLALVSEREELGAWPLEAIRARRLRGDTFAITVAGEDLHFVADDTISFAYSGMPAIERVGRPSRTLSPLRALLDLFGKDTSTPHRTHDVPPPPPPAATEEPVSSEPERSTQHPIIETTSPQQVIDTKSERHDISRDAGPIEQLDQDQPVEHEPTASPAKTMRCPGRRNDGLPCQSPVIGPSGYCYAHDPARAFGQGFRKAQDARARLVRKRTARLTRVYARLDMAFKQVERGDLDPGKAMAMAELARTMCAILELGEKPPVSPDEGTSAP